MEIKRESHPIDLQTEKDLGPPKDCIKCNTRLVRTSRTDWNYLFTEKNIICPYCGEIHQMEVNHLN